MFKLEKDHDREKAGWGIHYWIVDTTKPEGSTERYLKLVPAHTAEAELKKWRIANTN